MKRIAPIALAALLVTAVPAQAETSPTLDGSRASMVRQNRVAKEMDYTFLHSARQVRRFAEEGYLLPADEGVSYRLANVSHPYARPELRLFLHRLGVQYRAGCGEDLVVTSLVRPTSEQPRNSHPLSVHPTGMAADLRVSRTGSCVRWLESTLLSLEERGLLDVTREHRPPHFHVALFPGAYREYVAEMLRDSVRSEVAAKEQALRAHTAALANTAPVMSALLPGERRPEEPSRRVPPLLALPLLGALLFGVHRILRS